MHLPQTWTIQSHVVKLYYVVEETILSIKYKQKVTRIAIILELWNFRFLFFFGIFMWWSHKAKHTHKVCIWFTLLLTAKQEHEFEWFSTLEYANMHFEYSSHNRNVKLQKRILGLISRSEATQYTHACNDAMQFKGNRCILATSIYLLWQTQLTKWWRHVRLCTQ